MLVRDPLVDEITLLTYPVVVSPVPNATGLSGSRASGESPCPG